MFYKLTVLIVAAVLIGDYVYGADIEYEEDSAPELRNKVDDLLHKLKEELDRDMVYAQQALYDAYKKVDEISIKTQSEVRNKMQEMEDGFRAELDQLKKKAKDAGVNIGECLKGNEDTLVNLPNHIGLSEDMVDCISDNINIAIYYSEDAFDRVKKIVDEIENIKQDIKNCGHGFSSEKCLAKVVIKIEQDIMTLLTKIEADVAATVAQISQLEEKVEKCGFDRVNKCETYGKKILEDIGVCAAQKIITG